MSLPSSPPIAQPGTVEAALQRYRRRQQGTEWPSGRRDRQGRWYPSAEEYQECCRFIRAPSRAWGNSLLAHCLTAEHSANVEGVRPTDVRSVLARDAARKRPARTAPRDLCIICGASWACEHQPNLDVQEPVVRQLLAGWPA